MSLDPMLEVVGKDGDDNLHDGIIKTCVFGHLL